MDPTKVNHNLGEKIKIFIKKNFKILISFLLILIFIIIVLFIFEKINEKKEITISEDFIRATLLIEKKKNNEAKELLNSIILAKHKFYSPLSLNLIINKDLELDKQIILNNYNEILKIKSIEKENLNLFRIKKALILFSLKDEENIIKILNPIINSNSIWKIEATRLIGDYFSSIGENIKAEEYYKLLNIKVTE